MLDPRTRKRAALCAGVFALTLAAGPSWRDAPSRPTAPWLATAMAADVSFKSAKIAFDQGVGAYRNGYYEIAIPALEFVVARNDATYRMFAEFYLARIFSDSTTANTDHAKAYMLFQRIADEHADIDPDDLNRAPFVAKALTAVALYVKDGLPEILLKPDPDRAVEYLRHAATFFNEADAQFELAKVEITDDAKRPNGLHFLQKLAKESHPGAQAVLADLLWRGKYMKADKVQALALIRLAVENAASSDRLWIEEIYQNLFCGASAEVRTRSQSQVASWRHTFARPRQTVETAVGTARRSEVNSPTRACSNGEPIDLNAGTSATTVSPLASTQSQSAPIGALGLMPQSVGETVRPPQR